MPNATPWWGRISLLWLMAVPLCVVIYNLCVPIAANDFWYHARAGSLTATTGHIPTTNTFSAGIAADWPYFYQNWLGELIMYKVLQHGGLAWTVTLRSLCMGFTYAILILAIYRRCCRVASAQLTPAQALETSLARCTALGALATLSMSANNMDVRPQMFSFPLFALFAAALLEWPYASRRARGAMTAVLPLCMMLWANLHGAFFTGLLVVTGSFVGEIIYSWWCKRGGRGAFLCGPPLERGALRQLGLLVLWCVVAAMVNSRGPLIYPYVVQLSTNETVQKFIVEWQPPTLHETGSVAFFGSFVVLALLFLAVLRRESAPADRDSTAPENSILGFRFSELLILAALATMGWRNARAIVWYALYCGPLLATLVLVVILKVRRPSTQVVTTSPTAVYVMNAVMAVLMLSLIIPALPWLKPALPWPDGYRKHFAPTPAGVFPTGFSNDPSLLIERDTPVAAAEFLRRQPPRGRLFNEMVFGSYLTWALQPQRVSYADPRIELYPTAFWDDYRWLCSGPPDAASILERRGFTDALLDVDLQPQLIRRLQAAPRWQLVLRENRARLFRYK